MFSTKLTTTTTTTTTNSAPNYGRIIERVPAVFWLFVGALLVSSSTITNRRGPFEQRNQNNSGTIAFRW
jgi:hypothetical protein